MPKYVTIQTKVKKIVRRGAPGPASSTPDPTYDSLTFNTAAAVPDPAAQGQIWWDADEETLSFKQDGAILQLGQEMQWHVRNNSGADIGDGVAVMATGSIGLSGRITIGKMDGTDPANAKLLLGVTTETIADGEDGKVTVFGKIRGINTTGIPEGETWVAGDILWISDTTAGELTNIEPAHDSIGMPVAFVITSSATVGTLAVRMTSIDEHLVDLLSINAQAWDVNALGSVTTALTMDAAAYSEFTATLPLTGTTTTISFSNMPATPSAWPILHLITGATFDAPIWTGIDATNITLTASNTHNIGFQPVWTTSGWKIVAILMHNEADA